MTVYCSRPNRFMSFFLSNFSFQYRREMNSHGCRYQTICCSCVLRAMMHTEPNGFSHLFPHRSAFSDTTPCPGAPSTLFLTSHPTIPDLIL